MCDCKTGPRFGSFRILERRFGVFYKNICCGHVSSMTVRAPSFVLYDQLETTKFRKSIRHPSYNWEKPINLTSITHSRTNPSGVSKIFFCISGINYAHNRQSIKLSFQNFRVHVWPGSGNGCRRCHMQVNFFLQNEQNYIFLVGWLFITL